jgi:hypothetical protein
VFVATGQGWTLDLLRLRHPTRTFGAGDEASGFDEVPPLGTMWGRSALLGEMNSRMGQFMCENLSAPRPQTEETRSELNRSSIFAITRHCCRKPPIDAQRNTAQQGRHHPKAGQRLHFLLESLGNLSLHRADSEGERKRCQLRG